MRVILLSFIGVEFIYPLGLIVIVETLRSLYHFCPALYFGYVLWSFEGRNFRRVRNYIKNSQYIFCISLIDQLYHNRLKQSWPLWLTLKWWAKDKVNYISNSDFAKHAKYLSRKKYFIVKGATFAYRDTTIIALGYPSALGGAI